MRTGSVRIVWRICGSMSATPAASSGCCRCCSSARLVGPRAGRTASASPPDRAARRRPAPGAGLSGRRRPRASAAATGWGRGRRSRRSSSTTTRRPPSPSPWASPPRRRAGPRGPALAALAKLDRLLPPHVRARVAAVRATAVPAGGPRRRRRPTSWSTWPAPRSSRNGWSSPTSTATVGRANGASTRTGWWRPADGGTWWPSTSIATSGGRCGSIASWRCADRSPVPPRGPTRRRRAREPGVRGVAVSLRGEGRRRGGAGGAGDEGATDRRRRRSAS